ncbi:intradiol ring-cleavage dioxygenase, partial [Candidatus Thiomargarita nelsonii]
MNKDRRNILKAALGVACVPLTPSQPEGPFYPIHEQLEKDFDMTTMNGLKVAKGEKVYIRGTVVDENCNPVAGALVDLWQACHSGKYLHDDDPNPAELDPNFQYWAKLKTDNAGLWRVKTIIPGA